MEEFCLFRVFCVFRGFRSLRAVLRSLLELGPLNLVRSQASSDTAQEAAPPLANPLIYHSPSVDCPFDVRVREQNVRGG